MGKEPLKQQQVSMHQQRIRQSVIETAEELGMRKAKVAIAKKALAAGADWIFVSEITGLVLEDVERIAKGKKIDID